MRLSLPSPCLLRCCLVDNVLITSCLLPHTHTAHAWFTKHSGHRSIDLNQHGTIERSVLDRVIRNILRVQGSVSTLPRRATCYSGTTISALYARPLWRFYDMSYDSIGSRHLCVDFEAIAENQDNLEPI